MRLERLVIDSSEHTFAADFHPRLTVVGGLDRASRTALAGELIDALAGAKPGVHLELEARGRPLTVFRPANGRHRVIDTESVADVTSDHLGSDGSIDLFGALGVDRALARHTIRLTRDDLVLRGATDELVGRLAAVDQEELWEAAMRLTASDELLGHVAEDAGATSTDIELMDAVEGRHAELVEATETYDRIRLICLTIGDIGAIGALSLAFTDGPASGLPFLVVAIVGVLLALHFRRNVTRAAALEREVLSSAGATDYASFHVERVSALLSSDAQRRRFMESVRGHRRAAGAWQAIAGDISLEFALDHVDQIRASARLHTGVRSLQHLSESAPEVSPDVTTELAQSLLDRVEAVRALTPGAETLPMVIDDAFEDLEPTVKPMLLEMLSASAGAPQMILLTGDDDVVSWAQVEAMTGDVSVVVDPEVGRSEPSPVGSR